jgi:hypothetical protein
MTATAICLAETYDRAVSKYRVSTFGDLCEDRAASSLLTRPVCEVPPPPLPPSKKRFFPEAGGMRSHSICSSWRRASRERWSSSILDKIRHQSSYFGTAPSISPTLPRSGAVSRIAF